MVVYGVMLLIPRPIGLSGGKDMFSSTYRLGKRWCESAIKWLDTSGWAVRLGKFGQAPQATASQDFHDTDRPFKFLLPPRFD
jgi:hypothetical protein